MERKGGSTVAVTSEQVKRTVSKVQTLSPSEEKTLRMRHGAGADVSAPLPRAAAGNAELEDELLLVEMQLLRAMRARQGGATPTAKGPVASRAKDKIVRTLRRQK